MIKINRPACPNPEALKTNYKDPVNKKALIDASHGKCMYCESQVSHVYFGDVEHIRPKALDKYPHLEFTWENLGFVCARCNNFKKDKYSEETPFIDPYAEDPSNSITVFGYTLRHKNGSERGNLTILEIDLNRVELIERRELRLRDIERAIDACFRTKDKKLQDTLLAELANEKHHSKEYSMFCAALLAAHGH